MWWHPIVINPNLHGASTGWDDDDEQTPVMVYWDIYDDKQTYVGEVFVKDEKKGPTLLDLMSCPQFEAVWKEHDLHYRKAERTYVYNNGRLAFTLTPKGTKPKPPLGWCTKCDCQGEFHRTALVCPRCKAVVGGF